MIPRVSVVIPAYLSEATLESCVRSALTQTIRDIEIIVVDDASNDGTPDILNQLRREDARLRIITQQQNSGVAAARNRGVREALAPWIAFLDSDDAWEADKLARQLKLAEQTGAQLVFAAAACIDADGTPTGRVFRVPETVTERSLLFGNDLICSSVLIQRDLLLRHPMERSDLHEDYVCWLHILKDGIKAVGITEPLVRYRVQKTSKSGDKRKSAAMMWRTYRYLGFGFFRRIRYFLGYCLHGVKRYWL